MASAGAREQYDRPELDAEFVGHYMRDAISRGGYRAALDYYGGARAKRSEPPMHRLRAQGWLLGRLSPDAWKSEWMEGARACSEFDHMTGVADSARLEAEKRGAAILGREVRRLLRTEPADAAAPDPRGVPQRVWTVMLVLDAVGPVYSRTCLNAAAAAVDAEAGRRVYGGVRRDPARYDPLGDRLHQAPRGCQRWIICDVDAEMLPLNEPHYYYDLTDEGRDALEYVKRDGAPWTKAAVRAAARLSDRAMPDILEEACGLDPHPRTMEGIGGELDGLIRAWGGSRGGRRHEPTSPKDAALADLAPIPKCRGDAEMARLEHVLFIKCAVRMVHEIACGIKSSGGTDSPTAPVLIGKMQDLCRKFCKKVNDAPGERRRTKTVYEGGFLYTKMRQEWRLYMGELPASISDLYYSLVEYCKCRGLADDPINRPLSEMSEGERAALIKMVLGDSAPEYEMAAPPNVARPPRAGPLYNVRNPCWRQCGD